MQKNITCLLLMMTVSLFAKPKLSDYGENVFSQFGEDGIIREIFNVIGTSSKNAVEFGAADGFEFSNTANLWSKDSSWKAFLIESNDSSFTRLVSQTKMYSCIPIHRKVGISSADSLEAILAEYNAPSSIDILSIDIDGNDYYIFQSLESLRPRVIICEYNPTIPAYLDIYPEYDNYLGCSVSALIRMAKSKGYSLVAITLTNCFFVLDADFPLFSEYETLLHKICLNTCIRHLITDYAGNYKIVASEEFLEPYGINQPINYPLNGDIKLFSIPNRSE